MTTSTNPISVDYSDAKLRILVEEYITMQKKEFTFKGVCSFILYRAMEEEKTKCEGLYESDQLVPADRKRVGNTLRMIIGENRLTSTPCYGDAFADNMQFIKVKE